MNKIKLIYFAFQLFVLGIKIDFNLTVLNAAIQIKIKKENGISSAAIIRLAKERERLLKKWLIYTGIYEKYRKKILSEKPPPNTSLSGGG